MLAALKIPDLAADLLKHITGEASEAECAEWLSEVDVVELHAECKAVEAEAALLHRASGASRHVLGCYGMVTCAIPERMQAVLGSHALVVGMLLEFSPFGTLEETCRRLEQETLSQRDHAQWLQLANKLIADAAQGLADCQALGILDPDTKPDNILICQGDDGVITAKVADLGAARCYDVARAPGVPMGSSVMSIGYLDALLAAAIHGDKMAGGDGSQVVMRPAHGLSVVAAMLAQAWLPRGGPILDAALWQRIDTMPDEYSMDEYTAGVAADPGRVARAQWQHLGTYMPNVVGPCNACMACPTCTVATTWLQTVMRTSSLELDARGTAAQAAAELAAAVSPAFQCTWRAAVHAAAQACSIAVSCCSTSEALACPCVPAAQPQQQQEPAFSETGACAASCTGTGTAGVAAGAPCQAGAEQLQHAASPAPQQRQERQRCRGRGLRVARAAGKRPLRILGCGAHAACCGRSYSQAGQQQQSPTPPAQPAAAPVAAPCKRQHSAGLASVGYSGLRHQPLGAALPMGTLSARLERPTAPCSSTAACCTSTACAGRGSAASEASQLAGCVVVVCDGGELLPLSAPAPNHAVLAPPPADRLHMRDGGSGSWCAVQPVRSAGGEEVEEALPGLRALDQHVAAQPAMDAEQVQTPQCGVRRGGGGGGGEAEAISAAAGTVAGRSAASGGAQHAERGRGPRMRHVWVVAAAVTAAAAGVAIFMHGRSRH